MFIWYLSLKTSSICTTNNLKRKTISKVETNGREGKETGGLKQTQQSIDYWCEEREVWNRCLKKICVYLYQLKTESFLYSVYKGNPGRQRICRPVLNIELEIYIFWTIVAYISCKSTFQRKELISLFICSIVLCYFMVEGRVWRSEGWWEMSLCLHTNR